MIGPFQQEYRFLSNFYEGAPFFYKGEFYKTAEHAFQAAKARDRLEQYYIMGSLTPGIAKARGRNTLLRSDWEIVKDRIMYEIVHAKFFQNKDIAEKLIATQDEELVEINNWHDYYWGCDENGKGKNKLGKILMQVRKELNDCKCNSKT